MALETDIFNTDEITTSDFTTPRKRKKRQSSEIEETASRKKATRNAGEKQRGGSKERTRKKKKDDAQSSAEVKQRPLALRAGVALWHLCLAIVRLGYSLVRGIVAKRKAQSSDDEFLEGGRRLTVFPTWLRDSLVRHLPAWVILGVVLVIMLPNLLGGAGTLAGRAVGSVFDTFSQALNIGQPGYIAPLFTAEVDHWSDSIVRWARQFNLDPNLLATIMQIESCGWPNAVSNAGASGLFQVMPFHFATGENQLDPDTNAARSAGVLADCLNWADDNVGLTMACYNGGPSVLTQPYSQWSDETQRYYKWASGIYGDAMRNATSSSTLNEWLAAGGSNLCNQAAANLDIKQ